MPLFSDADVRAAPVGETLNETHRIFSELLFTTFFAFLTKKG